MGCACNKKNGRAPSYEVVVPADGGEKVVFRSSSEPTAQAVAKRYPSSDVRKVAPGQTTA